MKPFRYAKWIGKKLTEKELAIEKFSQYGAPSPYFYREFAVERGLKRATLYVSSLGWNVCFLNGKRVSKDLFTPGWTDYGKRLEYSRYDVTNYLSEGQNLFLAVLGDGWYAGHISQLGKFNYGEYPLKLIFALRLLYEGKTKMICSDEKTLACEGEVRASDLQNGEILDARCKGPFARIPARLSAAEVFEGENRNLVPRACPSIRFFETRIPKIVKANANAVLYDVGQNISGVVKLRVRGERGAVLHVRHGEILDADGKLFTKNLRTALATDTFILSGEGEEEFCPSFTFHGFRYFEVVREGECEILSAAALACSQALRRTGKFRCSSETVNRIFQNAEWSRRDNFLSVPMDCPQRDERLGWTGDAQTFCMSAMYLADCRRFFGKYLTDLSDATGQDGCVPNIAPYLPIVDKGFPAWSDAAVLIPWQMYLMYGDKQILQRSFSLMKKWVGYLQKNSQGYLRSGFCYGDWLNVGEETDLEVFSSAFYAQSVRIFANVCRILNKEGAQTYENLYENIRHAFCSEFVEEDGKIRSDTQTCYLLAWAFGLMSKEQARRHLIRRLKENGGKLTCGFIGVKYLLPALSEMGETETVYDLLLREDFPSWGYMVRNGATTIWERWNSLHPAGVSAEEMNSFNHYSLGSCVEWLFAYMLGIRYDELKPGFEKIIFSPCFDRKMRIDKASGSYRSVRGLIRVNWYTEQNKIIYEAEYPKECESTFYFSGMTVLSERNAEKNGRRCAVFTLQTL